MEACHGMPKKRSSDENVYAAMMEAGRLSGRIEDLATESSKIQFRSRSGARQRSPLGKHLAQPPREFNPPSAHNTGYESVELHPVPTEEEPETSFFGRVGGFVADFFKPDDAEQTRPKETHV